MSQSSISTQSQTLSALAFSRISISTPTHIPSAMGNRLCACFNPRPRNRAAVRIVFWGGDTALFAGRQLAGELMLRFPNCVICDGDAFYIDRPFPTLAIGNVLLPGRTYFVLPVDRVADKLTVASLVALVPGSDISCLPPGLLPFVDVKERDGRVLVKVRPEFIASLITRCDATEEGAGEEDEDRGGDAICVETEMRKRYAQLVGEKSRQRRRSWSPALETIAESE